MTENIKQTLCIAPEVRDIIHQIAKMKRKTISETIMELVLKGLVVKDERDNNITAYIGRIERKSERFSKD